MSSPKDYVDTKSSLASEENPCSSQWVRSYSCHRETSLGYDILPTITWLQANTNIWLLYDAATPQCSELRGCATLPQWVQPWVVASRPGWLGSIVTSMTQHLHCATAKSPQQRYGQHDMAPLSPSWLDTYTASRPSHLGSTVARITQPHCRQHVTPACYNNKILSN
jgi:hypothetical protein